MKSYAKINVFLKVIGKKNNYHELLSRFYRCDFLYDEIFLIEKKQIQDFLHKNIQEISPTWPLEKVRNSTICNTFSQDVIMDKLHLLNQNLISNFYTTSDIFTRVLSVVDEKIKKEFLNNFCIVLIKNIPTFAGLGGASSNAAAFIHLLNEIRTIDICEIAKKSGADVSFFASGLKSANVSGYGEIVNDFSDDECEFSLHFSQNSSTKDVFFEFSKEAKYSKNCEFLAELKTSEILKNYDNFYLNDLLLPCTKLYTKAFEFSKNENLFLSGSGGTFFKLN